MRVQIADLLEVEQSAAKAPHRSEACRADTANRNAGMASDFGVTAAGAVIEGIDERPRTARQGAGCPSHTGAGFGGDRYPFRRRLLARRICLDRGERMFDAIATDECEAFTFGRRRQPTAEPLGVPDGRGVFKEA
jgi:hypothetical protein